MKTFILKFEIENDAFAASRRRGIVQVLRQVAQRVNEAKFTDLADYQAVMDVYGNRIGQFAVKEVE